MAQWTYLLADLRTNNIFAQVPLSNVSAPTLRLNTAGQLSGQIPVRSIPGDPYRYTTPARTAIYALRDGQPFWGGIIWTRKYSSSAGTVDIQASDWWSYYDHRFVIGPAGPPQNDFNDATNAQVGAADPGTTAHGTRSFGYSGSYVGQNDIVRTLFQVATSNYRGGDIRLQLVAPAAAGTGRQVEYRNFDLVTYGKAFSDLAGLTDGPDLMFGVSGWDSTGAPQRVLWVGSPALSKATTAIAFTYGGNLLDYAWPSSGVDIATRTWAVGQADNISTMMARVDAADMIDNYGWPLLEAKTVYDTIAEGQQYPQLQVQAASDAAANRNVVVTPTLTVRTDIPPFLNYGPGDQARLLIADDYFTGTGLDITVRIIDVAASTTADTAVLTVDPVDDDIA